MPRKNIVKIDVPHTFYHVYARGYNKQQIYLDPSDYYYFISLFERYLSAEARKDKSGTVYPHYHKKLDLTAFCLMPNHFHLLVYQHTKGSMPSFMKSIMCSYGRYFNLKYSRTGSIYESTYKASPIHSDSYLSHISRYIHLNPRYWKTYAYSSLPYYIDKSQAEWLQPSTILSTFDGAQDYTDFLSDYVGHRQIMTEIKHELADS